MEIEERIELTEDEVKEALRMYIMHRYAGSSGYGLKQFSELSLYDMRLDVLNHKGKEAPVKYRLTIYREGSRVSPPKFKEDETGEDKSGIEITYDDMYLDRTPKIDEENDDRKLTPAEVAKIFSEDLPEEQKIQLEEELRTIWNKYHDVD